MQNKGIIGAVCGDIIGSAYEFHKTKDMNFKLFTPRSKFTDDTVMTCAVAEWLVDDPRHTHEQLVKIMHRYGDEFPHRGYGGMFGRWLEGHLTAPYNSFGHPEGIIGAQAVAATIFLLRNDEWIEKGKKFLKDFCFYDLDEIEKDWSDICKFYTFDVTCQGSVPEAIYCAIKNISSPMGYEKTIREAVSLGGDADTQGAIAGGIAAAVCEVPDDILSECLDRLEPPLADVIERFNEVCNQ